jgi:hypothetical protein
VRFPAAAFGAPWARPSSTATPATAAPRPRRCATTPALRPRARPQLRGARAISRTQHKSQGQGGPERSGRRREHAARGDARERRHAAPQERDLFAGVDTSWAQVPAPCATSAPAPSSTRSKRDRPRRAAYDARDPSALVAPLLRCAGCSPPRARSAPRASASRSRRATGTSSARSAHSGLAWRSTTRRCSVRGPCVAAGIAVVAVAEREVTAPGEPLRVVVSTYNRGRDTLSFGAPIVDGDDRRAARVVGALPRARRGPARHGRDAPRRRDRPGLAGRRPARRPVRRAAPPVRRRRRAARGAFSYGPRGPQVYGTCRAARVPHDRPRARPVDRPVAVAPAVSVTVDRAVQYARAGVPIDRVVRVHLRSASTSTRRMTVRLELPRASPPTRRRGRCARRPGRAPPWPFRFARTLRPGRHAIRAGPERADRAVRRRATSSSTTRTSARSGLYRAGRDGDRGGRTSRCPRAPRWRTCRA